MSNIPTDDEELQQTGILPFMLKIGAHVAQAHQHEPGSPEAIQECQSALWGMWRLLRGPLGPKFDFKVGEEMMVASDPDLWRRRLHGFASMMESAHFFEPVFARLRIALEETQRGVSAPEWMPQGKGRQGGLADTEEIMLICMAARLADSIKADCAKVEEYRTILNDECNVAPRTIEGYQKKSKNAPAAMRDAPVELYFSSNRKEALRLIVKCLALRRRKSASDAERWAAFQELTRLSPELTPGNLLP